MKFPEKVLGHYQQTLVATGLSQDFRNPDQMSAEQEGLKWIVDPQQDAMICPTCEYYLFL